MKIQEITDKELLEYLLYGYSLRMVLHGDISLRSLLNKQLTPQEFSFWWNNRNIYLEAFDDIRHGKSEYMYRTFDRLEYIDA